MTPEQTDASAVLALIIAFMLFMTALDLAIDKLIIWRKRHGNRTTNRRTN